MAARLPLPRAGEPDEVAEAPPGQVLIVDGGMTLVYRDQSRARRAFSHAKSLHAS